MTREELRYRNVINRIASVMLIFIVLFFILNNIAYDITYALSGSLTQTELSITSGLLEAFAYFFSFLIPALLFGRFSRKNKCAVENASTNLTDPKNCLLFVIAGVALTLSFSLVNALFLRAIGYTSGGAVYTEQLSVTVKGFEYVIMFISIAIVPAFCEEILFRGVIMRNLIPYGKSTAIIISALLFALMHQNPEQFLYTFFSGVILAFVCIETGSIWCSVLIHLFNNSISVLNTLFVNQFSQAAASYFISMLDGLICVLGLISLIILIRRYDAEKKKKAERLDGGFFGKNFEQSYSFAPQSIGVTERIRLFCTPMMLTFCIISIINSF